MVWGSNEFIHLIDPQRAILPGVEKYWHIRDETPLKNTDHNDTSLRGNNSPTWHQRISKLESISCLDHLRSSSTPKRGLIDHGLSQVTPCPKKKSP